MLCYNQSVVSTKILRGDINTKLYEDFEKWLNSVFEKDIPNDVAALNFNIYEDTNSYWSIEVIGASSFDEDNDDWACDEVTDFQTIDNQFSWKEEADWEDILAKIVELLHKYLEVGYYSNKIRKVNGIGTGFVDGDIELVYVK